MAERVGFEPTVPEGTGTTVFKTAALSRTLPPLDGQSSFIWSSGEATMRSGEPRRKLRGQSRGDAASKEEHEPEPDAA